MYNFKDIKTGVIGVGSMGQNHARVLKEISNLRAVADIDEVQGNKVADNLDITWYSDYRNMLPQIDAVVIAVPTNYHREVAENVFKAGVHALVEKPLSTSYLDGKAIVDAANSASLVLAVGHIERYNPVVKYAKNAISKNEWGQLITMSSKRVSRHPTRIKDVGVVFDLAIHDLDILRYLSGSEVETLFALGGKIEESDKEDHASIILSFKNGIEGMCEVSWLTPLKVRNLVLTFSKAYVELDYIKQRIVISSSEIQLDSKGDLFKSKQKIKSREPNIEYQEPLKLELEDFLHSIASIKSTFSPPLVTGEEGLKALIIAKAALKSIDDSKVIEGI